MLLLKGFLQSEWKKQHLVIIWVEQSLSNSAMYEHRRMENIKELYKNYDKCNNQRQYKKIIESVMVSTPDHRW